MCAWARIEAQETLANWGWGRKGTWAGEGSVRVLVPLRVHEVFKGADSWTSEQSEGIIGNLDFLSPDGAVFTSAGGLSCALDRPWAGAQPCPALPLWWAGAIPDFIFLLTRRHFMHCLSHSALLHLHTKIKNLQMFGLSFAPEINLLVKECVRGVKQQDSLEELFFLYLQQQCPSTHAVLILKGIAKVLVFSVIILNFNLQCVFWIGFSKRRKWRYCRAVSVAFSETRKALPEGFFLSVHNNGPVCYFQIYCYLQTDQQLLAALCCAAYWNSGCDSSRDFSINSSVLLGNTNKPWKDLKWGLLRDCSACY